MSISYLTPLQSVLEYLRSDPLQGLGVEQARNALLNYGPNTLTEKNRKTVFSILFNQLKEVMVLILLAAALISFLLGEEPWDGVVILVIVVLNTLIGFWQEFKAEKAMTALKDLALPHARVRRGGRETEILSTQLVPGDILLIEAGNLIPADGRLLSASNLQVQEAALTGESESVLKDPGFSVSSEIPLGDRRHMVFRGTMVTYGRGEVLVTATGMQTEIGHIADMLQTMEDEKTPLQRRLAELGRILSLAALGLIGLVILITRLSGHHSWSETLMTAISMAVAAIPEGLPAIVNISLALGAARLLQKKSLIRHLPAVETLGSVTYICSDKTGTLTQNRMTVIRLVTPGITLETSNLSAAVLPPDAQVLTAIGALCNDASIEKKEGRDYILGDPTEGSLVACARDLYITKAELETLLPRVDEIPFDSERKRMTTIHAFHPHPGDVKLPELLSIHPGQHLVCTKGAADGLLPLCTHVRINGSIHPINDDLRREILASNESMARQGIRVLGMAYRIVTEPAQEAESRLIFAGLAAMIDPVRPEVRDAVSECRSAGIHPVMITGDHPLTALAIGRELGIAVQDKVITGQELAEMSVKDLEELVLEISLYARVSPEHKMKIIDALQARGQVVAMTGDGVNDAPALKSADIGVAMGITGTDVSKEAADMILVDDNFTTIVRAVREGRKIYDNIRKFLKYILTGNLAEILVMLAGPFLGLPLPLLPIQILWINLVTDGLPAIALGYEPAEKNIMQRPPYPPKENIFARGTGAGILWAGSLTALVSVLAGLYARQVWGDAVWQTVVFTTLTMSQMGFVLSVRSQSRSLFAMNPLSNLPLTASVILTILLQLGLLYIPGLQGLFRTVPLSGAQLLLCFSGMAVVVLTAESAKLLRWIQRGHAAAAA